MSKRWKTLVVLLALGMVLAGCAGSGDAGSVETASVGMDSGGDTAPLPVEAGEGDEAAPEEAAGTDASAPVTEPQSVDRKVIRTGDMSIRASDTRSAMDEITRLVEASGGYVASSTVNPAGDGEQPMISVTVRVPAGELGGALSAIRDLADEVVSESIQSQDVTEEYTDIESRLRNLTALETELVALLAEVRQQPDADPQKLLQVFDEVSRVRGEIEVLEGRRRLLDDRAALSTITITITAPPVEEPIVEEGWQPLLTIRRATGDLVDTLQTFGDAGLWLLIYALPVLLILALPVWLLVRIVSRRSKSTVPPPPPPATPVPATTAPPATTSGAGSDSPADER